jgi:hypothetical protein
MPDEDNRRHARAGDPLADFDGDVRYLAEHTDLSPNQARELVRLHGHDRKKLLEAARTMKAEG